MFQNCQVCDIMPFGAFPIKSICSTKQGLITPLQPYKHSNLKNIHTQMLSFIHLLQVSRGISGQQQTPNKTNRPTEVSPVVSVLFINLFEVWFRIRVYRSVQALNGVATALYRKSSEWQNFAHLTDLKHQNTKTFLYKLSKNHWIFALFEIFWPVRKKVQFTLFHDHPVFNKGGAPKTKMEIFNGIFH